MNEYCLSPSLLLSPICNCPRARLRFLNLRIFFRPSFPKTSSRVMAGRRGPPAFQTKPGQPRRLIGTDSREVCRSPPKKACESTIYFVGLPEDLAQYVKQSSLSIESRIWTLFGPFKSVTRPALPSNRPLGSEPQRRMSA